MKILKVILKPFARKITTEAEYKAAVKTLSALVDKGSSATKAEREYLDLLGTLLEDYEMRTNPEVYAEIALPVEPVDAIRWAMDRHGLNQKDLCPYIGSESLVSAVLNGRRSLSKSMIVRLHEALDIPYENLLPRPRPRRSALGRVAAML